MKNADFKNFLFNLLSVFIAVAIAICLLPVSVTANAASEQENYYCDDDITYDGQGQHIDVSYNVYYDTVEVTENVKLISAPSYKNGDTTRPNFCAPLSGLNVVAYYDRWCTNLIPDYEPGMTTGSGIYRYFPDLVKPQVTAAFNEIYSLMKTNQSSTGGTTDANFHSGLNAYVKNAGYTLSKSSIYSSATTVNMSKLKAAIDEDKVALVMCSKYNYVYSINDIKNEKRVYVSKITSDVGHIMMVYGYTTYSYYTNGVNTRNNTYLYVSSAYGSGAQGYMELNDYSQINEAWVMSIN